MSKGGFLKRGQKLQPYTECVQFASLYKGSKRENEISRQGALGRGQKGRDGKERTGTTHQRDEDG